MEDVLNAVMHTKSSAPQERREILSAYADKAGIGRMLSYAFSGKEARAMLRAVLDLSTAPAAAAIVAHYLEIHRDKLPSLAFSDDPKIRKSTAQLFGRIGPEPYADLLLDMFSQEAIDMVRPSIILALGNCKGNQQVLQTLTEYTVPDCDGKHEQEHRLALDKALSSLNGKQASATPCQVPPNTGVALFCPNANVTLGELRQRGYQAKLYNHLDHTVLVDNLCDLEHLYSIRSFYSAGLLCGKFEGLAAAAEFCQSRSLVKLVQEAFGTDQTTYRVESSGQGISHGERKAVAESIAVGLSKISRLRNSPSSYDITIRLVNGRRFTSVFLCPSSALDRRFAYRQNAVSASVHPAVAASVMRFAAPLFRKNASVLDCFCGAGTMLFERGFYPCSSLTGSDISPQALGAARKNERLRKCGARFIMKNAVSPFEERFDEIICNMPFGVRVGSHDANINMYKAFGDNLRTLLKEDGTAFLFTNEKQLLAKVLEESFEIVQKASFSAGGLYPSLFVVRHKEKNP